MLPSPRDTISPNHRVYLPCIANPPPVDTNSHLSHTVPSRLKSLDLAETLVKFAFPLSPPLTPASALSSKCEARAPPAAGVDEPTLEHCPPLASGWSSSGHLIREPAILESEHSGKCNSPGHTLPSPTSPTRTKVSPIHGATESDQKERPTSRFLFVSGVPKAATPGNLEEVFLSCGDISDIFVRFQAQYGAIVLAFFDVRHAVRAHDLINTRTFFDQNRLGSLLLSDEDLLQLIGESNFIDSNTGKLLISTSVVGFEDEIDTPALMNVLSSFGHLRSFQTVDTHTKVFHAEYFDARDANAALNALNDCVILDVCLHLTRSTSAGTTGTNSPPLCNAEGVSPTIIPFASGSSTTVSHPPTPSISSSSSHYSLVNDLTRPPLHHSISEHDTRKARATPAQSHAAEDAPNMSRTKTPQHIRPHCTSNIYKFDAVDKVPSSTSTPSRPRSISVSSKTTGPVAAHLALPLDLGSLPAPFACIDMEQASRLPDEREHASCSSDVTNVADSGHGALYHDANVSGWFPVGHVVPPPHVPGWAGALWIPMQGSHRGSGLENAIDRSLQRNRVDIARIERGEDARTTVMIKNIPNKMTDRNLIDFINDVCPRRIDFLYLRMDFMSGCNVGYAFVNFIEVKDLLHFAKIKLGTRWNMFSSEKVLGMSYANYQGKEALIAKFRSSATMAQRESWRPKLFHSSGPQKGLPEDFPARNHLHGKGHSELLANNPHEAHVRR